MISPPDGRFDLDTVNLFGATNLQVFAEFDYTHPKVADLYVQQIETIYEVYTRAQSASNNNTITQADADAVRNALQALVNLAQNGVVVAGTDPASYTGISKTYFLTKDMATNLDLLVRSFAAAGATTPLVSITDAQLEKWKDLSIVSTAIRDILNAAVNAIPGNRSLQSLIELEYVAAGNDLINDKLSGLEQALTVTKGILNTLNNLQDLRNRLIIKNPPGFDFRVGFAGSGTDGRDDFEAHYRSLASAYFNQPIVPKLSSSLVIYDANMNVLGITTHGTSTFLQLLTLKRSLQALIPQLSALATSQILADQNSLYNRVKTILNDFNTTFGTVGGGGVLTPATSLFSTTDQITALKNFLIDNNDPFGNLIAGREAGASQANLTLAITAAENLNDEQKESVRQFLYVFEEYYKSASSILQRLSQIIEKMGQNISR